MAVAAHDQRAVAVAAGAPRPGLAGLVAVRRAPSPARSLGRRDREDRLVAVECVEVEPELLLQEANLQPQAEVHRVLAEGAVVERQRLVVAPLLLALGGLLVVLDQAGRQVVAPPSRPGGAAHARARQDRRGRVVGGLAHRPLPGGVPDRVAAAALTGEPDDLDGDPEAARTGARRERALDLVGVRGDGGSQQPDQAAEQVARVDAVATEHVQEVTLLGCRRHRRRRLQMRDPESLPEARREPLHLGVGEPLGGHEVLHDDASRPPGQKLETEVSNTPGDQHQRRERQRGGDPWLGERGQCRIGKAGALGLGRVSVQVRERDQAPQTRDHAQAQPEHARPARPAAVYAETPDRIDCAAR